MKPIQVMPDDNANGLALALSVTLKSKLVGLCLIELADISGVHLGQDA